jgi:tetratricopeptide (TPR) repeat protein
MKKYIFDLTALAVSLTFVLGVRGAAFSQDATAAAGCEKLKKEYDKLSADRDNLFLQSKSLLEYKAKYQEIEASMKKDSEEKERAQKDLQGRLDQNTLLQQKVTELESNNKQLEQERDTLKNSLDKLEIEYKIVPETKKEMSQLQAQNMEAVKNYKQLEQKIKYLEERKLDAQAQSELYRRQLNDFKNRYEQALSKNRALERKAEQTPKRLAEIARENKVLIKETALMHYNLGVFYTKNKEYSRAIAEFEKSIELNPDDAYAHYNLGYIYAEYMVNRPKAIESFRRFLRLTKSDDKDVDWVKKYMLTWQTWEAKKPVD